MRRPKLEEPALLSTGPAAPSLGRAYWRPRSWLLGSDVLTVSESEDLATIFEVRRMWTFARRYRLTDGDDRAVGLIGRDALFTTAGAAFVWCIVDRDRVEYRLIGGPVLATQVREEEGIRLDFVPEATANPFLRMLILGAVLVG